MAPIEPSSVTIPLRVQTPRAGCDPDRAVVWLRGEHDISTRDALGETFARAMARDDADLVVDLSGVRFMDASTVGVIVRTRAFLRVRSRSLVLRSPSRSARRVLDLCGLLGLVDPGPVATSPATGVAGALGTWVAVPAAVRVDRPGDASAPNPAVAPNPVSVGGVVGAARGSSSVDADLVLDELVAIAAGRGGP